MRRCVDRGPWSGVGTSPPARPRPRPRPTAGTGDEAEHAKYPGDGDTDTLRVPRPGAVLCVLQQLHSCTASCICVLTKAELRVCELAMARTRPGACPSSPSPSSRQRRGRAACGLWSAGACATGAHHRTGAPAVPASGQCLCLTLRGPRPASPDRHIHIRHCRPRPPLRRVGQEPRAGCRVVQVPRAFGPGLRGRQPRPCRPPGHGALASGRLASGRSALVPTAPSGPDAALRRIAAPGGGGDAAYTAYGLQREGVAGCGRSDVRRACGVSARWLSVACGLTSHISRRTLCTLHGMYGDAVGCGV